MRLQGASSGNPIQDIKDYGVEMGGPIKKGKAWIWGSFGKQNVDVGVVDFYQPTRRLPGDQGRRGGELAVAPDRGRQRLPEHRPDGAADDEPEGRSAAVQGQQAEPLQQLSRRRCATRATPSDLHADRDRRCRRTPCRALRHVAAGRPARTRPTSSAISGSSATGCCSTCSTRTSATTSSSTSTIRRSADVQPTLHHLDAA